MYTNTRTYENFRDSLSTFRKFEIKHNNRNTIKKKKVDTTNTDRHSAESKKETAQGKTNTFLLFS